MLLLDAVSALLLFVPLGYAAVSDFRHMIVPNWISIVITLGFAVFAATHWPAIDLQYHVIIAAVFFGIALICWFAGWLGGGDVKLLGAVGLWLGATHALAFLFILALVSAVLAGALLIVRRFSKRQVDDVPAALKPVMRMVREGQFAYAISIVIAAFATLPRYFI